MGTTPETTKTFLEELTVWQRVPEEMKRPLLDALRPAVKALKPLQSYHDQNTRETFFNIFLKSTQERLKKEYSEIYDSITDRNDPLYIDNPASPIHQLLYVYPQNYWGRYGELLTIFEQSLPPETPQK